MLLITTPSLTLRVVRMWQSAAPCPGVLGRPAVRCGPQLGDASDGLGEVMREDAVVGIRRLFYGEASTLDHRFE